MMMNLRAKNSIFKLLAATAIGAGFWRHNDNQFSISLSPPFLSTLKEFQNYIPIPHTVNSAPNSDSGEIPFICSRISPGNSGDSGKCGSGCLWKDSIANAAAIVTPAVVNILITHEYQERTIATSISSGTIIDPDGTILTCAHSVMAAISLKNTYRGKIDVTLKDGRTYEGTVVNADIHSDIAILKINSKTPLPTAKLGSSGKLRPGEWTVALGCPLSLQNTVTAGIVSCVDRKSSEMGLGGMRREFLQVDCAINKGNSGGPLVNLDGEIIGVTIMKLSAADGVSFAVPIDSVLKVMEHFKKNGRVVRPWLGMKMLDLNELIVAQIKEKDPSFPNVTKGVLVPMVSPGSPGAKAGFLPGDVVVEFDGKPAESIKDILERMGDDVGKHFKVVLKRAGDEVVRLTVVPEEGNIGM